MNSLADVTPTRIQNTAPRVLRAESWINCVVGVNTTESNPAFVLDDYVRAGLQRLHYGNAPPKK